jgi:autotransporter-associated beta strand protein
VQALTSTTDFANTAYTTYRVKSGGAVFDTDGRDITFGRALLADAGSPGGGLTKTGDGTLTLSGSNTYGGATTVAGGALCIDGNARLGNTTNTLTISNAGVLEVTAAGTLTNAMTIGAGNGVLSNASAGALVISGGVSKDGTVFTSRAGSGTNVFTGVISGESANSDFVVDVGTTVFSNVMTYNGPTIITSGGTLVLGVDDAMPSGSDLILGGGTFRVGVENYNTASAHVMGTLTLTEDSTIDLGGFGTSGDRLRGALSSFPQMDGPRGRSSKFCQPWRSRSCWSRHSFISPGRCPSRPCMPGCLGPPFCGSSAPRPGCGTGGADGGLAGAHPVHAAR